jgi:hypothetical protein
LLHNLVRPVRRAENAVAEHRARGNRMKTQKRKTQALSLALLVAGLAWSGLYLRADTVYPSGYCPLCGAKGMMIPEQEEVRHTECEQWWYDKNVTRIVVADCSKWDCPGGSEPEIVVVDLPLYRCPKDGLLFTDRPE